MFYHSNCQVQDIAPPIHAVDTFREDVLTGLRQTSKRLQSKYFYDKEGDTLPPEAALSN